MANNILILAWLVLAPAIALAQQQEPLPQELAGENPCIDPTAIGLPRRNMCIVPVKTASTWRNAMTTCERAGGQLYQLPSLIIDSNERLMRCLAAMEDNTFNDLWFSGIGFWFQHFYWLDGRGSVINPVDYCSNRRPPSTSKAPLSSRFLSVDYCVSTCHEDADSDIVVHHTDRNPQCYCVSSLSDEYKVPCNSQNVNYQDRNRFYIIHSKENSLIHITDNNAFTSSEILCATVDQETFQNREMSSDTCFTKRPFICDLGNETDCPQETCQGQECLFTSRGKCLKRANYAYTWFEARAYCNKKGGDLWLMKDLQEMVQVGQYLSKDMRYWIGGSNYVWQFNVSKTTDPANFQAARCGHMSHQQNTRWQWSDADCQQPKSYLCQFTKQDPALFSDSSENVTCPWPIPDTTPFPSLLPITPSSAPLVGVEDDDSFPIAALIAGIIAGLILLTCLVMALTFCWRRQWVAGKVKQAKDRLAFIPYFSGGSNQLAITNTADFESMSNAHMRSNMSSVSENGSQIGLVKGGYHGAGMTNHAFSSSYNDQGDVYSYKTLDQRQRDAMARNSSMDERGFASSYNTMASSKPKDYMTLQAEMNIQDDAGVSGSMRGKPEVALVTDHVDMNFTVNHAMSHTGSGLQGQMDAQASRSSLDARAMEQMTTGASEDAAMTLTLPKGSTETMLFGTVAPGSNGTMTFMPEQVTEARIVN